MIVPWISLFLCLAPVQKPCFFIDETATADWICNVFTDAPPPGGVADLVCHLQPQYLYQNAVWLVNAIINVEHGETREYHCVVVYYDVPTQESGLVYDKVVPDNVVKMILKQAI